MTYVVCDIDGTLADDDKRLHYALAKDWESYNEQLVAAALNVRMAELLVMMHPHHNIMLLSGNSELNRPLVEQWVRHNRLYYDHLLLRPTGNETPSHILKLQLLEGFFGSPDNVRRSVAYVFEDRNVICKAMREYGLTVHQVKEGRY